MYIKKFDKEWFESASDGDGDLVYELLDIDCNEVNALAYYKSNITVKTYDSFVQQVTDSEYKLYDITHINVLIGFVYDGIPYNVMYDVVNGESDIFEKFDSYVANCIKSNGDIMDTISFLCL